MFITKIAMRRKTQQKALKDAKKCRTGTGHACIFSSTIIKRSFDGSQFRVLRKHGLLEVIYQKSVPLLYRLGQHICQRKLRHMRLYSAVCILGGYGYACRGYDLYVIGREIQLVRSEYLASSLPSHRPVVDEEGAVTAQTGRIICKLKVREAEFT